MNWLQKQVVNLLGIQSKSIDKQYFDALFQWQQSNAPIQLPDNYKSYIENGYNKNLFVYSVISYIARKAAEIEWCLYRENNGEIEKVEDHPLLDLIYQPNQLQDAIDFREQCIGYYLITGNTYNYKVAPKNGLNAGRVKEIYVLPSQYIEITAGASATEPIKGYELTLMPSRTLVTYEPSEIMHVKMPNYEFINGISLYGQSPLKSALQAINASNSNMEAIASNNQNMGALGILSPENMGNLTAAQARTLENKVRQKINGTHNSGKVAYTNMPLKWQQLGLDARSMQLIEQHDLSRQDICTLFNVPAVLFGDNSASTYNNVKEAKKSAYTDGILPPLRKYLGEFNREIVEPYNSEGDTLYFDLDLSKIDVLQQDMKELVEWMDKAPMTDNEKRAKLGLSDIDTPLANTIWKSTNEIPYDSEGLDIEQANKRFGDYK